MTPPGAHGRGAGDHDRGAPARARLASGREHLLQPGLAVDTVELFTFIGATQLDAWEKLIARHGGDQTTGQQKFKQRLSDELDRRGVIDVLRRGWKR